jgi:hypothetical protein
VQRTILGKGHFFRRLCDSATTLVTKMHLVRMGTDGSSTDLVAGPMDHQKQPIYLASAGYPGYQQQHTQDGPRIFFNNTQQITSADQGAAWYACAPRFATEAKHKERRK